MFGIWKYWWHCKIYLVSENIDTILKKRFLSGNIDNIETYVLYLKVLIIKF
jgi:hypothetical protein